MIDRTPFDKFFEDHPDWMVVSHYMISPPTVDELKEDWGDVDATLLEKCDEVIGIGELPITRGTLYTKARLSGGSDRLATMLALQSAPRGMTDDVFFAGIPTLAEQFGSDMKLKRMVNIARKQGYEPQAGDVYQSGLARFEGDREAYVSRSQGRGYIRRLCEKRGWACEGGVTVANRAPESDPLAPENCKPMANDLIRANASRMIKKDPSLARKSATEIRQAVLAKHGPTT